jgi:tripartite-type tricarboxylate transporter receptor subunit TctC
MRRVVSVAAAVILGLLAWVLPGLAQQYPSRVVTMIVPYPAGGPTDQLARVLAPVLSEKLGQNFIVENVAGGTTIATARVARATPTVTRCCCTICRYRPMSRSTTTCHSTPRRSRAHHLHQQQPVVLVGRKTLEPNTPGSLLAYMKPRWSRWPSRIGDRHLATSLSAQEAEGHRLTISVSRRRTGAAGHRRRPRRSVLRYAAVGGRAGRSGQMKAYGITAKETSPQFPTAASFVQELAEAGDSLLARAVRAAERLMPSVEKVNSALQEIMADPAIVKSWADTASRLTEGSAHRCRRPRALEERDRTLGTGRARQQYSAQMQ